MKIELSPKQIEYIRNATHRFNFKIGATQCGKTHIDVQYIIPNRIMERIGKKGLTVILGVTKETIERNVLEPMRDIWGQNLVGEINNRNWAMLFGEKVYCLGSEKVSQVSKLRGAKFKYVYIDEIVDMNKEVFELLKSRMSLEYSCCDATGNPSYPTHYIKKFMESEADVYYQQWSLYDNPFIPQSYIKSLEIEYKDSVYFFRYILGLWKSAEGLIYRLFTNNEKKYSINKSDLPNSMVISIGIDFGGNGSKHAFVASGIDKSITTVYALKSRSIPAKNTEVKDIIREFELFAAEVEMEFGEIDYIYADSEEQVIINTMRAGTKYNILNSIKNVITDRIRCESVLLGSGHMFLVEGNNEDLAAGLRGARWNEKKKEDERLDDGTSDIDIMDAFEYSWEYRIKQLIRG